MQPKESLTFRIGLSGTYWDRIPNFKISVDDELQAEGLISGPSDTIEYVEFTTTVTEDCEHKLSIRFDNKTDKDTVQSEDFQHILKDMLLNIHSIEIDGIDIGNLIWTKSIYVSDDPTKPVLYNCVNLGWVGTYTLTFSSPFYLWVLENM